MTRDERLAKQEAKAKKALEAAQRAHNQAVAASAQQARENLKKRRYKIGLAADTAGLLALDDATLAQLFQVLAPLAALPHPVAVLEGCMEPATALALGEE